MVIEIEKKYRLTKRQRESVRRRLREIGARLQGTEFEENTLYSGRGLKVGKNVLRLRRVGDKATLTYKERYPGGEIKHQREDETVVNNAEAMSEILAALGFKPTLLYEKHRETWKLAQTEIVIDELPFGVFMEIEGSEKGIRATERKIGHRDLQGESLTYPQLTKKHGRREGDMIEARFGKPRKYTKTNSTKCHQ